jgi:hypothetical protein
VHRMSNIAAGAAAIGRWTSIRSVVISGLL